MYDTSSLDKGTFSLLQLTMNYCVFYLLILATQVVKQATIQCKTKPKAGKLLNVSWIVTVSLLGKLQENCLNRERGGLNWGSGILDTWLIELKMYSIINSVPVQYKYSFLYSILLNRFYKTTVRNTAKQSFLIINIIFAAIDSLPHCSLTPLFIAHT